MKKKIQLLGFVKRTQYISVPLAIAVAGGGVFHSSAAFGEASTVGEYVGTVSMTSGKAAEAQHNYAKAALYYRKAMQIKEIEDQALVGLVRVLWQTGETQEANELVQKYLTENPFNPDVRLALADIHIKKEEFDKASKELVVVDKVRPGYRPTKKRWAQVAYGQKDYEKALGLFAQCLADESCGPEFRSVKATALLKLGKYDQATEELRVLTAETPADGNLQVLLGETIWHTGNLAEAEKVLRYALKLLPNSTTAMTTLADILSRTNRLGESTEILKRATEVEPTNKPLAMRVVNAYLDMHQVKRAQDELTRIYKLMPTDDEAPAKLVELYNHDGRLDIVGQFLKSYLDQFPGKAWASIAYAKLLSEIGQQTVAAEVLHKTIHENPDNATAYLALSVIKSKSNQPGEAIEVLAEADKKFKGNEVIQFDLAVLLEKNGTIDKAIAKYKEIEGKNSVIFMKSRVNLALIYEKSKNYADALDALKSIKGESDQSEVINSKISALEVAFAESQREHQPVNRVIASDIKDADKEKDKNSHKNEEGGATDSAAPQKK